MGSNDPSFLAANSMAGKQLLIFNDNL